jgi:hypothetical protein
LAFVVVAVVDAGDAFAYCDNDSDDLRVVVEVGLGMEVEEMVVVVVGVVVDACGDDLCFVVEFDAVESYVAVVVVVAL